MSFSTKLQKKTDYFRKKTKINPSKVTLIGKKRQGSQGNSSMNIKNKRQLNQHGVTEMLTKEEKKEPA